MAFFFSVSLFLPILGYLNLIYFQLFYDFLQFCCD
jgi:hypothetical protein